MLIFWIFFTIFDYDGPLSEDNVKSLREAEVLLTDPGLIAKYKLAQSLPNLKLMQSTAAGVDSLMKSLDQSKPLPQYKLSRFGGCFGEHMAEFVISHIVAHERGFQGMRSNQNQSKWKKEPYTSYRILQQLQIGILGAGDIGKQVAESCKHFKMTVWGMVSRDVPVQDRCAHIDHYRTTAELSDILVNCDYICSVLPSTPKTKYMLSGDVLQQCMKKPVLINIGRGDVIDEASIITALDNGWISQAILDVFEVEPLPADSKLWTHPNVTVTPHISACSFDWQVADKFEENFKRYTANETLQYEVNWDKGY